MTSIAYLKSPIGYIRIEGSSDGIQSVRRVETAEEDSPEIVSCVAAGKKQLQEYFARKRQNFDLQLDYGDASEFYQSVWNALLQIPYGHTTSYSFIADQLGDTKKVRAVGQANRNNRIAIIVPCHRVIAKNGDLQGYFYGLDIKRQLLEIENPMSFATQGSLF